jgi:hypothetical protein
MRSAAVIRSPLVRRIKTVKAAVRTKIERVVEKIETRVVEKAATRMRSAIKARSVTVRTKKKKSIVAAVVLEAIPLVTALRVVADALVPAHDPVDAEIVDEDAHGVVRLLVDRAEVGVGAEAGRPNVAPKKKTEIGRRRPRPTKKRNQNCLVSLHKL